MDTDCDGLFLSFYSQILKLRAQTESIQIDDDSLTQLGQIGVSTTLRYVQLGSLFRHGIRIIYIDMSLCQHFPLPVAFTSVSEAIK